MANLVLQAEPWRTKGFRGFPGRRNSRKFGPKRGNKPKILGAALRLGCPFCGILASLCYARHAQERSATKKTKTAKTPPTDTRRMDGMICGVPSGVGRETNTWERLAEQGSKPGWAGSGGFQRPEFRRISLKETMMLDTRKNPDSGTNFAPCPSATLKKTIPVHALSRRVAGAADERETQKRCPIGARLFWSDWSQAGVSTDSRIGGFRPFPPKIPPDSKKITAFRSFLNL